MSEIKDLTLPERVDDLIKMLNEVFPERSPDLEDDTKHLYFKAGQRDVVRFINLLKARQNGEDV
jgi:hypothetical protein